MPNDVVLPNVGFGMEEGTLIAWRKRVGEAVRKGEIIAEIEGDKTTVELAATVDGVLVEQLYEAGATMPVGGVIARIDNAAASPGPDSAPSNTSRVSPLARRIAEAHGVDAAQVAGSGRGGRVQANDIHAALATEPQSMERRLAAPAVRKLARDSGLDLRAVRGSAALGRITRADVEAALGARQPTNGTIAQPIELAASAPATVAAPEGRREVTLSNMRWTIARKLTASAQEAPHFHVTAELDFTRALAKLPAGVGVNALLLYLTVQALRAQPALNATFEAGKLFQYEHVHLSLAVALPDGLLTPVLQRADDYSLSGLAERSRDLIAQARSGKLAAEAMTGGTFTVSNLGVVPQIDRFTAILNPPQVGILAIGALRERPFVIDGGLFVRRTAHLTLSADHRVVDGMLAAQFLGAFDTALQAFAAQC